MSFSDLGLIEPILRSLETLGYTIPTLIQSQAIPPIIEGRDVLGSAQTGTGKTAAFALPIIHRLLVKGNPPKGHGRRIRAVVVVPTRELAVQVCESFLKYGRSAALRVIAVYGGVHQSLQVRALRHGVDILIATPGRMVDLMEQGFIDLGRVETMVLDEADMMFDMGFAPNLRHIMTHMPKERQNLLFSATMPAPIELLARQILKDPARIEIIPEKTPLEIIDHRVSPVTKMAKPAALIAYLKSVTLERAIVFTRTKYGADKVTMLLVRSGFSSEAIHGDKRQNVRQRTLNDFKTGRLQVLVATDIAARGIDVTGISHVINFDIPLDPETYVHRVGRTGRAGAGGTALSLCQPEERRLLMSIERLIGKRIPVLPFEGSADSAPTEGMDDGDRRDRDRGPRTMPSGRPFQPSRLPGKGGTRGPRPFSAGKRTASK
jgi:ATP-dependent RNA helicase RhlE